MRTIIDIPDEQLRRVDTIARRRNWSRAATVRKALEQFVESQPDDFDAVLDKAIAAWSHIEIDGLEWQQRLRAEWDSSVSAE
ncbi:ribbon-helix-helix domain-containing protein [Glacieibacterium frigidum]|uniref:Ribbon-helix-helix protein, CopG family n=1 Tax=Glacieibacterium frigidum TaxID=2593303 RepID=A0A552UEN5_9SPHN|nr:CopG family transcriptional regulator [Glacieibacterium frigidum]TRW16698.1 ribbon-helix-helix protein, CopG family [Glacieibacterium frigidum]